MDDVPGEESVGPGIELSDEEAKSVLPVLTKYPLPELLVNYIGFLRTEALTLLVQVFPQNVVKLQKLRVFVILNLYRNLLGVWLDVEHF